MCDLRPSVNTVFSFFFTVSILPFFRRLNGVEGLDAGATEGSFGLEEK